MRLLKTLFIRIILIISIVISAFLITRMLGISPKFVNATRIDPGNFTIPLEEKEFPLAFSIIFYKDQDQVHRLLRAIYRPFNLYCLHIDRKSHWVVHEYVQNMSRLHDNIILPERFVSVKWGTYSVLEAELVCMESLLRFNHRVPWRYFINLTGQEWPLKTNLELVRIFKVLNGANLVEKAHILSGRISPNLEVPYDIHIWQGQVHVMLTQRFVEFLLTDPRVLNFTAFLRNNTYIPDEILFASVSHSHKLHPPGGYSGYLIRDPDLYPSLQRYKIWRGSTCYGRLVRNICIFSKRDIPAMISTQSRELIANKFILGINDEVLDFMETWFDWRSNQVYANPSINPFIDLDYYQNLPQVKNHW